MIDTNWVSRPTYNKPLPKRRVGKRIRALWRRESRRLAILDRHSAEAKARHEHKNRKKK